MSIHASCIVGQDRRSRASWLRRAGMQLLIAGASLLTLAPSARAETQVMPTERWQMAADSKGLTQTNSGALLGHLDFDLGLWGNYERNPMVVRDPNKGTLLGLEDQSNPAIQHSPLRRRLTASIANRAASQLSVAIGLFNWVELFGTLPVVLYQDRGEGISRVLARPEPINQFALGDARLGAKIRILRAEDFLVDLAVIPTITLPIGLGFRALSLNTRASPPIAPDPGFGPWASGYVSEGFPTFQPELALSRELFGFFIGGNVGLRLRRPYELAGVTVTQEVLGRVGVGFKGKKLADRVRWMRYVPIELGLEATGAASINHPYVTVPFITPAASLKEPEVRFPLLFQAGQNSAELLASAGLDLFWVHPFVGASVGLLPGYGTPDFRVFGGVRLSTEFGLQFPPRRAEKPAPAPPPPPPDTDKDGLIDTEDQCPNEPGPRELQGCPPPPDGDQDGIIDAEDQCPTEPGLRELQGCPPPPDPCTLPLAERPATPEAAACPDGDKDGDGIINSADACVDEPETVNEFEDQDGCPDEAPPRDSDGDGFTDDKDYCPADAEDKDGFEDEDGCPDRDNDHDGVPDTDDKCPAEPETINGVKDDDGCPDKGKTLAKLDVVKKKIEILEKVYFDTGKATIKPASFNLLRQVALVLKANDKVKVRIEGHTDNQGSAEFNQRLSQERAQSVRDFLVQEGVAAERLEAVGFGQERPVASNNKASGREANRRVEFVVTTEVSQ